MSCPFCGADPDDSLVWNVGLHVRSYCQSQDRFYPPPTSLSPRSGQSPDLKHLPPDKRGVNDRERTEATERQEESRPRSDTPKASGARLTDAATPSSDMARAVEESGAILDRGPQGRFSPGWPRRYHEEPLREPRRGSPQPTARSVLETGSVVVRNVSKP